MINKILDYDHNRDFEAVKRIYFEIGWFEDEEQAKAFEPLARAMDGVVFPVNGEVECVVFTSPGNIRYLDSNIEMTAVTGVATGRIARKLGAAKQLTAHALAYHAAAGREIATLGMFEQGFYNLLGFGTSAYTNVIKFDPASLQVNHSFRPPKRLTRVDGQALHQALRNRLRTHGNCVLDLPEFILSAFGSESKLICLGYFDGPGGSLSHFIMGETKGENGPYEISYYTYQSTDQLFELLALIKSLGDQVLSIQMEEPPEIQFQDLLKQPFRDRNKTWGSRHACWHIANSWRQLRILDLPKCLTKTRLDAESISFNLTLSDPISEYLNAGHTWRGVSGDYVVTLGAQSAAEPGYSPALPTLKASVSAFSRLWFGVRSASVLALTDDLGADGKLLRELDRTLRLPQPQFALDF